MSAPVDEPLKIPIEVEGIPKPTVQFYKDGKEIVNSDHLKIIEEGNTYTIMIDKTTLKDTGSYSLVASNEIAQISQYWKLDIFSKPKVMKKLGAARQVSQNEQIELKLQVQSVPEPEVTW